MEERRMEKGFGYIELVVCISLVAIVIGPLSKTFLTSIQTRIKAQRIEEATGYIEQMMVEIKEQMNWDILFKHQEESGKTEEEEWYGLEREVYEAHLKETWLTEEKTSRTLENLLSDRIWNEPLEKRFNMESYGYEVALWKMDDLSVISGNVVLDMQQAVKFYSEKEVEALFGQEPKKQVIDPIYLKMDEETFQFFNSDTQTYDSDYNGKNKKVEVTTVSFNKEGVVDCIQPSSKDSMVKVSLSPSSNAHGKIVAYELKIEREPTRVWHGKLEEYVSVITMDCGRLSAIEPLRLKVVNQTDYNQVIQIKQDLRGQESIGLEEGDMKTGLWQTLIDDQGKGKSTVIYTGTQTSYENYIIMIRIKDKRPLQGEEGQIIKQMIDLYSYDRTIEGRQ
ncbi:MAG: type II secretion system protein [Cellulosilyticum sp.]|nr:type II secretion system protein [Cellulosilyticum sp.]